MGYYLYNGYKHPALPASAYQYALIWQGMGMNFLEFTSVPLIRRADGGVTVPQDVGSITSEEYADHGYDYWKLSAGYEFSNNHRLYSEILWANYDILNEDGKTVYLAASDPVPVTTINPSALMQGFFVGDAIKRNR